MFKWLNVVTGVVMVTINLVMFFMYGTTANLVAAVFCAAISSIGFVGCRAIENAYKE